MSRPVNKFSFDSFLQKISSYDPKISLLVIRLEALLAERRSLLTQDAKIDFIESGQEIYDGALEGISTTLLRIKQNFPKRVEQCGLFQNIESQDYLEKFRDNFFKLFIDRIRIRGEITPFFFNRANKELNPVGSDLIYAEGFAVAFFAMLLCVEDSFKGQKEISADEFLNLYQGLGGLAAGRDTTNNEALRGRIIGYKTLYDLGSERALQMSRFGGGNVWFYPDGKLKNFFAKDFDHIRCATSLWQEFQTKKSLSSEVRDVEIALCDFMGIVSCDAHILRDGNGRASLLTGAFLSIFYGVNLPISLLRACHYPMLYEEAAEWSRKFFLNPETPALEMGSKVSIEGVTKEITEDFSKNLAVSFIANLFKERFQKVVAIRLPCQLKADLVLREYGDELHITPISKDKSIDSNSGNIFNCRRLDEVVEKHKAKFLAITNPSQRSAHIALAILEELNSLPKLTTEEKNLGNLVFDVYEKNINYLSPKKKFKKFEKDSALSSNSPELGKAPHDAATNLASATQQIKTFNV